MTGHDLRQPRSGRLGSQDGFILPVALFVLVLLSMIVATGIYSARHDLWAAAAVRHAAVALAAADAGASRLVATWAESGPPSPPPGDSIVIDWQALPDGSLYRAVVYSPPVGPDQPPASQLVLVTTGRARPPVNARRTVVTILGAGAGSGLWSEASTRITSRLRVSGSVRNDPLPEVDGTDRIPPGWPLSRCPNPLQDVPGAITSDSDQIDVRQQGDIGGSPPIAEDPDINPLDFIDFGGLSFGDLVAMADVSLPPNQRFEQNEIRPVVSGGQCESGVPTNWGSPLDPAGACGDHSPTIYAEGNLWLSEGQGQGILLVERDLYLQQDFVFYGLIIVLGRVDVSDNARVYGAVMARGNQNGRGISEISDEGKILYSSCAVQQVQTGVSGSSQAQWRSWFEVIG